MERFNSIRFTSLKKKEGNQNSKKKKSKEALEKQENLKKSRNFEQQVIQYDQYRLDTVECLIAMGKGLCIITIISYLFYRNIIAFLVLLPLLVMIFPYEKKQKKKKRYHRLEEEFKETLITLSALLRAGYSLENAMKTAKGEMELLYGTNSLMVKELCYLCDQLSINIPVEIAWKDFASRSGVEEIFHFAQVTGIAKKSGGDLSLIMCQTAEVIRDKMQVKEEIKTITASKRFEQKIMNLIPLFVILYVELSTPEYFNQMYNTFFGKIIMTGCLFVYAFSFYLAQKILSIKV